ncbi:lysylphosphatidylglycerol synthase transmembrane domain-containing protein [Chloroflexota bacterium]
MTDNTSASMATSRKNFWRILPGVLISLVAVGVLFTLIDWPIFVAALQKADYRYLLLALPIYLVSYLVRSRAWHILLMEEPSFKLVFFTEQAGYLMNNVLPFRLGELGRAALLGRHGLGFWRVLSTIVVERAFDMIIAAGLLLGTLAFVVNIPGAQQVGIIVGLIVLTGMFALYLLARNQVRVLNWFDRLSQRWPRIVEIGRDKVAAFLSGLSPLTDFRRFIRVLLWLSSGWGLAIVAHYFILLAFVPDATLLWMAFSLSVAMIGIALPSSPGYIGVYEAALVGALAAFGVPYENALAFALVDHVIYLGLTGILGGYALLREGQSLGQLFRRVQQERSKDVS